MNTLIKIFLTILLLLPFSIISAQDGSGDDIESRIKKEESRIAELRKQIEELKRQNIEATSIKTGTTKTDIVYQRVEKNVSVIEVKPMNNQDFDNFCKEYSKEAENLMKEADTHKNINSRLAYSCFRDGNRVEVNMYYETVSNRPQINLAENIDEMKSKRPQVDKVKDTEIENYKKQLQKVRNTKKLYQDLANELQHQMNYNLVETVDNAGDLVLKHVSIPQGDALKAKAMEELRKNAGVDKESPIENKVADVVNLIIDDSEKLIELVPGGDKLTNHYLWKLFKSTPEAGKGLGHLAASVNIYFRKNEYNDKIQELDNTERQLIKLIEQKH